MAERTQGIYSLVTIPAIYLTIQNSLGAKKMRKAFESAYFSDFADKRVLEVGCGPGTWAAQMANTAFYTGVDWNQAHIQKAEATYGSPKMQFICDDVSTTQKLVDHSYDVVCAFGLLHHLDDDQAKGLLQSVERLLKPGGEFFAVEPVFHSDQHWFARWMKNRDSGQNIRTERTYVELIQPNFASVKAEIHTDKLRIPYSHCVLRARL